MADDTLERLLEALDTEKAHFMLRDLRDPERRTPQLYNAIEKLLERHKFTIQKLKPDASLLGDLASSLDDVRALSDEELYGTTH
ncbi:DNA packaging protein [Pseudomonas asplenii]|uniref:DNA packaging protein n=1 Tax=Pseudomonas asplenii TaxID=53407 RepID=UPI0006B68498|nr:DNA packaging protein [Pseudomonas fuscovaginae]KPA96898.1 DNA packaging protein [Pseudomonas fuscovaginae]